MPVVINEIVISVEVNQTRSGSSSTASTSQSAVDSAQIVKECVEQVMEILKQKNER